jgi:hypothetical protein
MKTSKPKPVRAGVAMVLPAALKPLVEVLSPEPGVTVEKGWGSSSVVLKARGKIFVMLVNDELDRAGSRSPSLCVGGWRVSRVL